MHCRRRLRGWFATADQATCALLVVHCGHERISGRADELTRRLTGLDRETLDFLVLAHCSSVEMPRLLSEFHGLRRLELFNSTLVSWGPDAAITTARHPTLRAVRLIATNMSALPAGLVHADVPAAFSALRIIQSNLSSLPPDIGDVWCDVPFAWFEVSATPLRELPASMRRLSTRELVLRKNQLTTIDGDVLADARLRSLTLSGNPLQQLPSAVGDMSKLVALALEKTSVASSPAWLSAWLLRQRGNERVTLFGSPLCSSGDALVASFCGRYMGTDVAENVVLVLSSQRE
ncbi:hypothetical protein PINS_up017416 [Pythium insidiosum]|nr:hypothetical protein PINS_up017416 [Pythium insidiosum]